MRATPPQNNTARQAKRKIRLKQAACLIPPFSRRERGASADRNIVHVAVDTLVQGDANVNINNVLATSEQDFHNSGEPGSQAKVVNHLETPLNGCFNIG